MRNRSGTVNAFYEGIRCTTDEVKTYARARRLWQLVVGEPSRSGMM